MTCLIQNLFQSLENLTQMINKENEDIESILSRTKEILESGDAIIENQMDLILTVFSILLGSSSVKRRIKLTLSSELVSELEGELYDRIAKVITKTFLIMGDNAEIPDDRALEMIRDLLYEFDEFIFVDNEKRAMIRKKNFKKFR